VVLTLLRLSISLDKAKELSSEPEDVKKKYKDFLKILQVYL